MREIKFRAWDIGKHIYIPQDLWAVCQTNFKAFGIMLKDWENYREGEYFYELLRRDELGEQLPSCCQALDDIKGKYVTQGVDK
jgi:hypothetical protein